MKKATFLFFCIFIVGSLCYAQNEKTSYTILLTGASFASPENGWFELGCKAVGATPINRAVGGEAIVDAANRIINGTLYTKEELETLDAFVIMQVHDQDVADESQLKNDFKEYSTPFDRSNYAVAYDFVIKRYLADCYNLKFDKNSKYYNTTLGKPAVVVFCTHWHDVRATYNASIRKLSEKWGIPVVEFDKFIGFSKNQLHPVTGDQISILYTDNDLETVDGVQVGWHQHRGKDSYIQQRMAAIFADTMRKILPVK